VTAPRLTEAQFQTIVTRLAKAEGWVIYHPRISQFSPPGWPDLVLVRDRILFRELKTDKGPISDAQIGWITKLRDAGGDADVWRPADMDLIRDTLTRRHLWTKESA
jgi:hypothetical protein